MRKSTVSIVIAIVVFALAAAVLSFVNQALNEPISQGAVKYAEKQRKSVIPEADAISEKLSDESFRAILAELQLTSDDLREIYIAKKGGKVIGYVFNTSSGAYKDNVDVTTGINIDGRITGAAITYQVETPGLGGVVADETWTDAFKGKSAMSDLSVVKTYPSQINILSVTGATVTSKSVVKSVNYASWAYRIIARGNQAQEVTQ